MSSAQPAGVYPPPSTGAASYGAPPPAGYPMRYGGDFSQPPPIPIQTNTRGDDGFWKGCCAALCCCCVMDACF